MKKVSFIFILFLGLVSSTISQTVQTLNTSGTFTVPCGVTSIFVECWGGGGAGGGNTAGNGGSGGGAGGYCSANLAVTPGQVIVYTVGAAAPGVTAGNGNNGNPTSFLTLTANGGTGGGVDGGAIGIGGTGTGGTVNFQGGDGFIGVPAIGGGGGASASAAGNGTDASSSAGAIALAGGANGGAGATAANGGIGLVAGGGGGGSRHATTNRRGGTGARGKIIITYTPDANSGCDLCTAFPIASYPFVYTGNTTNFSNFLTGTCLGNYGVSGAANDMFFSVNIPSNDYYLTMSLTGTDPSAIYELSVLTAPSCSAGPFGCLANGAWGGGLQTTGPNYGSTTPDADSPCRTVYFPTAGTYYLAIDGNAGANGPFTLNVSEYTSPTSGDNCSNAIGLSSGIPITITNTDCIYTMGPDDPTPSGLFCAGTVENTNWFHFQSDGSGTPVDVLVNAVSCDIGYFTGTGFYADEGQFGILTGGCSGPYASVAGAPCSSLATGDSYSVSLPNTGVVDYYFVWDGNGGAECTYTITVTNITPLPVELLNFEAVRKTNQVNLFWSTMTETNNDYFLVERSTDGINYSNVSRVAGNQNSNRLLEYKAYDYSPLNELTYYRLSQVDLDGRKENLKVVAVNSKANSSLSFSVYPNPSLSNDEVIISASGIENQEMHLNIYDIAGKLISSQNFTLDESGFITTRLTKNLSEGVYLITINDDFGNVDKIKYLVK